MKSKLFVSVLVVLIVAGLVFALPTNKGIDKAKEKSPAIDDTTGELRTPPEFVAQLPESQLNKVVFIRYAPGKEPTCDNDGTCEKKENWKNCPNDCTKGGNGEEPEPSPCYGFLSGAKPKWNWIEDYYYNETWLKDPSLNAVNTWETPTSGNIFGAGDYSTQYGWGDYNYYNSINYGDYDDAGECSTPDPCVLGVTAIWYRGKNIYEYDIMFDIDFFPGNYDLPTVTLHEFGHAAGLDDLYDTACIDEVMYGYLGEDEVKTDLVGGDITGIQTLYG